MITLLILHGHACAVLPKGVQLLSGVDPNDSHLFNFAVQAGSWLSPTLSVCTEDMIVWDDKMTADFQNEIKHRTPIITLSNAAPSTPPPAEQS